MKEDVIFMKVRDKCEKKNFVLENSTCFTLELSTTYLVNFSITLSRTIYNFEYFLELQNGWFFSYIDMDLEITMK